MDLICKPMYGMIANIQTTATKALRERLFPYLKAMKSAMLLILLTREILMIFELMKIHEGMMIMGPI